MESNSIFVKVKNHKFEERRFNESHLNQIEETLHCEVSSMNRKVDNVFLFIIIGRRKCCRKLIPLLLFKVCKKAFRFMRNLSFKGNPDEVCTKDRKESS
jgi:hypothetical protein